MSTTQPFMVRNAGRLAIAGLGALIFATTVLGLSAEVGRVDLVVAMSTETIRTSVSFPGRSVVPVLPDRIKDFRPGFREIAAHGWQPAKRATSRVSFDYQVLLNFISPQPSFPHPTVPQGTLVTLCDAWGKPFQTSCPAGETHAFRTTQAVSLNRPCIDNPFNIFDKGYCSAEVVIVADEPGLASNLDAPQGTTDARVHFADGTSRPLRVISGYTVSGGENAHPFVTQADRAAARYSIEMEIRRDLVRDGGLYRDKDYVLISISESTSTNTDFSESARFKGWAISPALFTSTVQEALQAQVPPGQRLLKSTIKVQTLAARAGSPDSNITVAVTAQTAPMDETQIARAIVGQSFARARATLLNLKLNLLAVRKHFVLLPIVPLTAAHIRIVVNARQ